MKLRVAVLYGGRSGEHEVSVRSARAILERMDREKYEAIEYFIDQSGKWAPGPILPEPGAQPDIDVVFPVLHGTFGEDGTVQGLLELADVAYVGAGVLGSSVAMDKDVAKRLLREAEIPIVDYAVVTAHEFARDPAAALAKGADLDYPLFCKPANAGSSIGVSRVSREADLPGALK